MPKMIPPKRVYSLRESMPLKTEAPVEPWMYGDRIKLDSFSPGVIARIVAGFLCIPPIVFGALCTLVLLGLIPASTLRFFAFNPRPLDQ